MEMVAVAGMLAVSVIGCGKEQPEPSAPAPTPMSRETAAKPVIPAAKPAGVSLAALDAVTKADQPYKIVLIVKTRNNPFFKPMIEAFAQTAKELGAESEVQAPPQEMDKEKQFALVQDEVSKGVKAICIAPADSKAIVPALKQAQDKGVLVVNLDNRVDGETAKAQGVELGGYVGADNEAGGKLAGMAMLAALVAHGKASAFTQAMVDNSGNGPSVALGPPARVAILEGIRGADNAEARKRGFTEAAQGKLDIVASETAEWDTEKAYAKTQNILAAHPDIVGIFCANDKMALGAMKAISEAHKQGKIIVVGYDNIPDVQPALQSGEMTATIEQHPDLMGKYGAKMAVGILNGRVAKGGEILVPLETIKKR
jgi:ribose transport system substrate-binding protein